MGQLPSYSGRSGRAPLYSRWGRACLVFDATVAYVLRERNTTTAQLLNEVRQKRTEVPKGPPGHPRRAPPGGRLRYLGGGTGRAKQPARRRDISLGGRVQRNGQVGRPAGRNGPEEPTTDQASEAGLTPSPGGSARHRHRRRPNKARRAKGQRAHHRKGQELGGRKVGFPGFSLFASLSLFPFFPESDKQITGFQGSYDVPFHHGLRPTTSVRPRPPVDGLRSWA